jgi:hypothetical protein
MDPHSGCHLGGKIVKKGGGTRNEDNRYRKISVESRGVK